MKRDVFLSHATSDKASLADPLYHALRDVGLSVWYDGAEIDWGDSIVGKIEDGLKSSRYVLVLLTPNFLRPEGHWRAAELETALSQQISSGVTRVLPLVHRVPHRDLLDALPIVASRKYEQLAEDAKPDLLRIAQKIQTRLREHASVSLVTREEVDDLIGKPEYRMMRCRRELRVLGNDCKLVVESLSREVEEALKRGVIVRVMCVAPESLGSKTLPFIDPRFPKPGDFEASMLSAEKVLKRLRDTYGRLFEFKYLPFAPAMGLFITDPDDHDRGVVKLEIYGIQPFEPLGSRPHLVLGSALEEWRKYFLQQWDNYWTAAVVVP
jgi:TIR domain